MLLFYPGSFDPLHVGHLDIITRAQRLGRLVIGIGSNPSKAALLTPRRRLALVREAVRGLPGVEAELYRGSTLARAQALGAVLVRGIRNATDLEFEASMASIHRTHGLETLFLLSNARHSQVSSRAVRMALAAGLPVNDLVPEAVAKALERRASP